jgi:2-oxo-4-hydroxy-4-carboxy--5-ureidoimidazoline (OHCU) decarboxylase
VPHAVDQRPSIAELNAMSATECAEALAPLFEGAPRFLARLCAGRPFASAVDLFDGAHATALAMPEDEQLELVDAHPRLGAAPASVSTLSHAEQGYDRETETADMAAETRRTVVAAELDRLNAAYEARFGFRYCVFVAGRARPALLPAMAAALEADRASELRRALESVVEIARDRYGTPVGPRS